jgi:hypothetical protein
MELYRRFEYQSSFVSRTISSFLVRREVRYASLALAAIDHSSLPSLALADVLAMHVCVPFAVDFVVIHLYACPYHYLPFRKTDPRNLPSSHRPLPTAK